MNWVRLNRPKVPSQLSECGGAGTGCGWCIPFLKQIFERGSTSAALLPKGVMASSLDVLSPEEYAALRADYVAAGKGKPPPGAEPIAPKESAITPSEPT